MVKNVVFDLAGVLADLDIETWFSHYGREKGLEVLELTLRSQDWQDYVDYGDVTEDEMFRRKIGENPRLAKELEKFREMWYTLFRSRTDTEDLIRRLKQAGYSVYYLSNFPGKTFLWVKERTPAFGMMDGGVVSYEVHQAKPNADIYETLLAKYRLKAGETVFTDDTLVNVESARKVGLYAWHFDGAAGFEKYLKEELGLKF